MDFSGIPKEFHTKIRCYNGSYYKLKKGGCTRGPRGGSTLQSLTFTCECQTGGEKINKWITIWFTVIAASGYKAEIKDHLIHTTLVHFSKVVGEEANVGCLVSPYVKDHISTLLKCDDLMTPAELLLALICPMEEIPLSCSGFHLPSLFLWK